MIRVKNMKKRERSLGREQQEKISRHDTVNRSAKVREKKDMLGQPLTKTTVRAKKKAKDLEKGTISRSRPRS